MGCWRCGPLLLRFSPPKQDDGVYKVASDLQLDIIAGGPCVLVKLGFNEAM